VKPSACAAIERAGKAPPLEQHTLLARTRSAPTHSKAERARSETVPSLRRCKARSPIAPLGALVSSNPCARSLSPIAMIARRTRSRSWLYAAVVPIAVAGAVYAAAQAKLAGDREPLHAYRLRFGMTPADVRATFSAPTAEDSRWRVDSSAEPALEWRGRNRSFRFEFHNAQLMAVRAVVESRDPSTHGGALEVSTAAVLRRVVREDGRVELTLVARDCPSHAEEARRLIASQ
jgi:hypothetical protein